MFQILMVVIVNLKTSMFPPLTAMVIQDYEDLEILKLLARLARDGWGNATCKCRRFKCFQGYGIGNLVAQPTFLSSRSNAEMHPPEADGGIQGPLDDAVFNSILGSIRALLPASLSLKYFVLFFFRKKVSCRKILACEFVFL